MAQMERSRSEMEAREEGELFASKIQLQLATAAVDRIIERNGGRRRADAFWHDGGFGPIDDEEEYVDPELWNPDEETVPEMAEIYWNIYECN